MSLIFIAPNRDMQRWEKAVLDIDPNLDVEIWPDIKKDERVQFAVIWQQPEYVLQQYQNLKAISSIGAGVDHILMDDTVPDDIPVCRIISDSLVRQMKEYILNAILNFQHNISIYFRQRRKNIWRQHENKNPEDVPVGIMGLGALGKPIARTLAELRYSVSGWSKSPKNIANISTFSGDSELEPFLEQTKILICLLPLTSETRDILGLNVFRKMQHPGYLINVARGKHLIEEDLLYALDKGWMTGACLDVFRDEPLPENHPFWNREKIMITPHISSITPPEEVAGQIVDNYKRVLSGLPLKNKINRQKGY